MGNTRESIDGLDMLADNKFLLGRCWGAPAVDTEIFVVKDIGGVERGGAGYLRVAKLVKQYAGNVPPVPLFHLRTSV